MKPQELVRPEILALKAYHVPEAKGMVKLDAMENPYPLPENLRRELADSLSRIDLNRYPDPSGEKLRRLIARRMKVPPGADVILGNGSDELLQIVTVALARPGASLMFPTPNGVISRKRCTASHRFNPSEPVYQDSSMTITPLPCM